jgi:hypothetical protein
MQATDPQRDATAPIISPSVIAPPVGGDLTSSLALAAARRSRSLGDITDPLGAATVEHDAGPLPPDASAGGATAGALLGCITTTTTTSVQCQQRSLPPPWRSFLSPTSSVMSPSVTAMVSGCCSADVVDALPSSRRAGSTGGGGGLSSASAAAGSRSSLLDSPEIIQVS